MPIVIDSAPKGTAAPGNIRDPYPLLKRNDSLQTTNLGGKYALPAEFESTKLAAGFYAEGQEALSMQQNQPVVGSAYIVEGWKVWKYPDEVITGYDEKNKPIMSKHPMAGQPHKVAGTKPGENFVLMFRSADVQYQVNHVYGMVSIETMSREQRGETLSGPGANDPGMLTDLRLKREIGAEREIEEAQGRSTAVHGAAGDRIERSNQKISR